MVHGTNRLFDDWKKFANEQTPNITSGEFKSISLFSGALGLDIGLHAAGFSTPVALDIDKYSKAAAEENFPGIKYFLKDIRSVDPKELMESAGVKKNELDLLAGGPPCQPFSKSGLRKGLKDDRGDLFSEYIRILEGIKPKAFLLENVRGILSSNKGKDFENILEHFNETGYTVFAKVLDAANYGIPQFRQRLFIVGFRDKIDFEFPEETHGNIDSPSVNEKNILPLVTIADSLSGLDNPGKYPEYKGKFSHLLQDIPEGLNYSYYCKERGHPNPQFGWRTKFWYFLLKADQNKPSLTIQANPGNNTGPFHWKSRRFGINELKRLQTFPEWYKFSQSYFVAHKLIGNAVPSLLGYRFGIEIAKSLKEHKELPVNKQRIFNGNGLNKVKSYRGSGKGKLVAVGERAFVI